MRMRGTRSRIPSRKRRAFLEGTRRAVLGRDQEQQADLAVRVLEAHDLEARDPKLRAGPVLPGSVTATRLQTLGVK